MAPDGDRGPGTRSVLLAVNLKTYLDAAASERWCRAVRDIAASSPAVRDGRVSLAVLPAMPLVRAAVEWFAGSPVLVGAQDVSPDPWGPSTGETPALLLAQLGCRIALVGHAERRRLGESDAIVARKLTRALEAGLSAMVCVGEEAAMGVDPAVRAVVAQLERSLAGVPGAPVVVAYEPVWAIGAERPAGWDHVLGVCGAIDAWLRQRPERAGSRVVYGGSAGPSLLGALGGALGGLFLGRSVHDPAVLAGMVAELDARARDPRLGA